MSYSIKDNSEDTFADVKTIYEQANGYTAISEYIYMNLGYLPES